ncbi:MAG: TonB-dependent receptor [Saprospiraceae bacterium]
MKPLIITSLLFLFSINLQAQTASLKGLLEDENKSPVSFANVALFLASDSSMLKVETSDEAGVFQLKNLREGNYFIVASYVGYSEMRKNNIQLTANQQLDLGKINFNSSAVKLQEATVTASRVMVEVKPDRTVFNVEGTINSVGSDAISLLRKAPGVTVDNNDNINVLGRAGVLLYIDGKRLPLVGDDLKNYLQNLTAEQIDRIDIITNPGAKYEAEGNAGIIDIRLKKDKSHGANGSISSTYMQGIYPKYNINSSGNYRNKKLNAFAAIGGGKGEGFNKIAFESLQNGLILDETNDFKFDWKYYNVRFGVDFFLGENHTLGILFNNNGGKNEQDLVNRFLIRNGNTPNLLDSSLVANTSSMRQRSQNTFNINYRFDNQKGRSLNLDLDYGVFANDSERYQPNRYYDNEGNLLTEIINSFDTPTDIDIYTFKADFEDKFLGGQLGFGTKLSRVVSDNTFLFFDEINGEPIQNDYRSNIFEYTENVYAAYVSYARALSKKWNISAGLRAEQTDAIVNLQAFVDDLKEPPVELNYLNWFPNVGLTYQVNPKNMVALNVGRRINRPDYNVLNPFNNQLSQLSYERGNPFLNPEIVNNIELGYTYNYRYNFKIGYSQTDNQITRLIGPDEDDDRASFISWENLAKQTVMSFNVSAPFNVNKWWDAYVNISGSHLDNQATYENGGTVDLQAFTYSLYQQSTFKLPAGFKGEVSGFYSGPGVWGGVFKYDATWSLNLGLQRKFLNDQLNIRVSADDIFYTSNWSGVSSFNGLVSTGYGNRDSRRVNVNVTYRFGNQRVKSRRRQTGLESEGSRVGGGVGGG